MKSIPIFPKHEFTPTQRAAGVALLLWGVAISIDDVVSEAPICPRILRNCWRKMPAISRSGDDVVHHLAMHVGQSKIPAGVVVGQFFMIEA